MDLPELNERWRATGHPHAIEAGDAYIWVCPKCQEGGRIKLPLHAAMSDSLVHKKRCAAVS